MFKLLVKESHHKNYEWELLCEYLAPEQAYLDYHQVVESILEGDRSFEYVMLELNGRTFAFFSSDDYYGIS